MPDGSASSLDNRHLLLVGAGSGLGMAVARRFARGAYRVTLVARSTDGLGGLADGLADTGAQIDTIAADASDPEGLGTRMTELYNGQGAPGLVIYNAVMGAPDQLLNSSIEHLQTAYAVDVISAIVVTQVAAPAMRAAGSGTIIVTGPQVEGSRITPLCARERTKPWHSGGMKRPIQTALRRLTQATRPLVMRSAGTVKSNTSVIRHVGRRSGQSYETPVVAVGHDDDFLIALPYGDRTDWMKNVSRKREGECRHPWSNVCSRSAAGHPDERGD